MSPIVSCYLLGPFNGCRRLPHGVFVDDPIAAANNAWDIAVGDRMEPVVVQMETGFMTFRIQKQVCREIPGGS